MTFQYITNEQLNGFDSYKYSCKDTSPLSNWVMHPFWNATVKLFPRWVAPNLLTLLGFLFLVSQTILLWVIDPDYKKGGEINEIPKWAWLYSAFAHFMAHTLDGIDGKQARRTGSSSPLGEMFDHGLDSWSTSLFLINFVSLCGQDGITQTEMYILLWILSVNFLCSHWEKYNTGIMYLPWGYDISQVTILICYLVAGFHGTAIFYSPIISDINAIHLIKMFMYAGSAFTYVISVKNVVDAWRNGTIKQPNLKESFRPWAPLVLAFIVLTIWIFVAAPYDTLRYETRTVLALTGVVFANIACRLVVVQMSSTRADLLNPLLIPLLAGTMFDFLLARVYLARPNIKFVFAICFLMHVHYGFGVVRGLANYLNIKVFKINPINTNSI